MKTSNIIGEKISEGGWFYGKWMSEKYIRAAEMRMYRRGVRHIDKEDEQGQCGGCKYFGALNADWGLCLNRNSPLDGRAVFEHNGCESHSDRRMLEADIREKVSTGKYDAKRHKAWRTTISAPARKMVLDFFGGDRAKTKLWFSMPNPLLGQLSPNQMMSIGRAAKLERWIKQQISANKK